MRVYATAADLAAYPGGTAVPAGDADTYLRAASRVVDECLKTRAYDVDVDGMPTDVDDVQNMADATCAIALEAFSAGALSAGASQEWASVSIGRVSLSGKSTSNAPLVLGLPVPPAAAGALSAVGSFRVVSS